MKLNLCKVCWASFDSCIGEKMEEFCRETFSIFHFVFTFTGGQKVDVSPIQPQVGTLCRIKGENISVPSNILHVVT